MARPLPGPTRIGVETLDQEAPLGDRRRPAPCVDGGAGMLSRPGVTHPSGSTRGHATRSGGTGAASGADMVPGRGDGQDEEVGGKVLELLGLSRRYGDLVALDDLSFTVREGQMFGFVGPNGAGKTTTMRIVLGVLEPDRGEVRWRGRPVDAETRRRFGYMPEERGPTPKCGSRPDRYFAACTAVAARRQRRRYWSSGGVADRRRRSAAVARQPAEGQLAAAWSTTRVRP